MGRRRYAKLSAYRVMWVIVMFDLPVTGKVEMRRATRFRNNLLELGFVRKQFSVYIRHCETLETAQRLGDAVGSCLTDAGSVSVMFITDRQYGLVRNYYGTKRKRNEKQVRDTQKQLLLF